MAQIVVSYASEDRPVVEAFIGELELRSLKVWWDGHLRPDDKIHERIRTEIGRAACVVVVWSPTSVNKDWVIGEALLASDQHKLITVCATGVSEGDLPLPFRVRKMVSIRDIDRVCDTLRDYGLNPNKPDTQPFWRRWFALERPKSKVRPALKPIDDPTPPHPDNRDLPTRRDQGVTFRLAKPQDLDPVTVVAQCLDNQWAPRRLQVKQMEHALSLAEISNERNPEVRRGFIGALLSAKQVVINRAFLYCSHVLAASYSDRKDRPAFEGLLSDSTIVPFLFGEDSPLSPVKFDRLPESDVWPQVAASSDLTCLRLDWDETSNKRLIDQQLARRFHGFAQTMTLLDADVLCTELQLEASPERVAGLRARLSDVASFALVKSKGGFLTKTELYKEFVTPDGAPDFEGRIDRNKPFALQIKQLLDLQYNVNLSDALDRFTLTPIDSPPRSALQELQLMTQRAHSLDMRDLMRVLANIRLEDALKDSANVPLENIDLETVRDVRRSGAFTKYLSVARRVVPDQSKRLSQIEFINAPDEIVSELTATYQDVLEEASRRQKAERKSWRPKIEIVLRIAGTTLGVALTRTAGSGEIFLSAPEDATIPTMTNAPVLVELCILEAGRRGTSNQTFGVRIPLIRGHVDGVHDSWSALLDSAKAHGQKGAFTLNLMPVERYHSRHEDTGGIEQKDEDAATG